MVKVEAGKFHARAATHGYALNKMCFSLNGASNRAAYAADPVAYCASFHLTDEEREAAISRDKQKLLDAGANMYFFSKLDRAFRPAKGA